MSALFNPAATVETAFKNGLIGQGYGFKWYETANLWTQIAGTRVASLAGTLSGVPANGSNVFAVTGFAAGATIKRGDTFALTGVNAVNPMTRASYGKPRKFSVQADVTLAGGAGNITVSPPITYTGAFANVDAAPAANAALTFDAAAGSQSPQGLGFNPQAFTWACINQEQPGNADTYFATDPETGIQLRFARQWEGRTNNFINRFDVLYAFGAPYPQGAVRVNS